MLIRLFKYIIFLIAVCCIPSCLGHCFHEGQTYSEGRSWNASCNICSCHLSAITCTKTVCPAFSCQPGEVLMYPPNECCPQCLPYKKPCNVESITYMHNDVWSFKSKCIFYQCQDGSSVPFIIQCPSLVCDKDENIFTISGECCPKCVPTKCDEQKKSQNDEAIAGCFQNMTIAQNCQHKSELKQNLIWKEPCTFCVTENGDLNCYSRKCSACTSFSSNEDLCCPCVRDTCGADCLKCSMNNASHCNYCKDLSKAILNGKCVDECPKNFFKDENMHCKNCPPNCKTCFGNMTSQCSSCKSGYLLQKGHCVKTCNADFYETEGYCLECHESCSSCDGPSDEDCKTCVLSGQLLQNGKCVDDCDGHFYVSEGVCLACNESCVRCLKNGTCQYCEEGFYLQEGICFPECDPGYYTFLDAYCLPCHEECQECSGPLPYQCISCPFNQYLLESSCVWDCGQGYFGDLGAGVCRACHPKCRTCLGGDSEDKCLSCSNGYLLPYIGTHFGSCVEKCPEQYYLMESGICGTCYETCETCFGPNDTDCISCNNTSFKNGACVPHCSLGYFEDEGICYACHPSCATCFGFGESECHTCPPGRKFKYGKCVPECKEGKYNNSDGNCIDCHPTCADCLINSGENKLMCIKCKNQQHNIYRDECIPECASDFYLNSYQICTECHPSCATCERTGATSCASCWPGNFLTHLGTCEPQCHNGYFSSGGICESCNSNCHECDNTGCLKCKGDLVLQFGECVSNCSDVYYLDAVTRHCRECSKECRSCRGPSSSDCTSCFPGTLFQDGVCLDHCSTKFFQDGDICRTCDLKCETCSNLNECTSCADPYFLLKNECVDDCGPGYYSDFETFNCEDCSVGCASCISPDYCVFCFDGYFLMNFGCVKQCPPEYYGDLLWRICKKNIGAPSLHANGILKLQSEGKVLISASFLSVSDEDSDFLLINVSSLPRNGFLLKMSEKGEEIMLSVGENFTSSHLKDGWIFFKHIHGIPLNGDVKLKVTDGYFLSDDIILPLQVSSVFPPVIEQTSSIIVTEGSSVVLNTSFFTINDPDNLNDITLNVIEAPCSGKLVLLPDQKEIWSVSHEEFLQNKVALKVPKKALKYDDKFTVQISDGYNSVIADIQVFILPEGQKQLFLLRNNSLLVKFDELTKLTNEHLYIIGEKLLPRDVVFTVEKSSIHPFGIFYKTGNNSKRKKLSSGTITFTQEDINQERISYKHTHSANATQHFVMRMKATSEKSKAELNFEFEIQILKYDDVLILPEEINQFGMMVLQNHPATITNDHLQIKPNGISTDDILYMITRKLAKDEGFLESLDKPGYRLQSFTQKDIDNMKIVYHPPPYAEASETNYVFQFIVLDAKRRIQLSAVQNFTITVRPQSTEFTSPSSSIDYEATIIVPQGQSVELGRHWLSTVGHEIPDDQLEVVLNIAPQHGNLTQKQFGNEIKIEEDDGFSFTSIIHDTYYTHDGSNKFKDSAVFKIMGGPYSSLNKVNFNISPNDRESPVILDSTSLMGSATEGKHLDLRRNHLAFTDFVSGDHDIFFTLRDEPKYGKLSKLIGEDYQILKISDTFTQKDINDGLIRYTANDGIGNNTVKDFLSFDVSDGSGNVQPNQILTMKVKPKIRHPPVVKVQSDVKVNEGGEAVIEPDVITASDRDSPLSDLIAFITKQPDYGFLENSRPIPGAEKSLDGIPISSFSYIDLQEGYIKYIQLTHRNVEPEKDTVYIRISDGYLSSPAHLVNITIKPINDEIPLVYTQRMSVLQGGFVKVLNSSLSVSDGDTSSDQLYIQLDKPPEKGRMWLMASNTYNYLENSKALSKHDTFTFQDVLDGLIMYVHEESQSHENDTFSFTVSDANHFVSGSIDVIVIIVRDREVPYLIHNLGLELMTGDSSVINSTILSAVDSDSSVELLKFTLSSDPSSGELFLMENGTAVKLSFKNSRNYFIQKDIDEGNLFYRHYTGDPVGSHYFKFNVNDPANNTLLDQKFFISISEDLFPPVITQNTGLEVEEKKSSCINSSMLAAVDEHQKDKDLIFSLSSLPTYGYLEMKNDRGKPITKFLMSDLKAGQVCYVHKSDRYSLRDRFTFTVTDGKNYILQTFNVNITTSYNEKPFIRIYPLSIEEGSQKHITEFEIDIFDRDSSDLELIIMIISPPSHGNVMNNSSKSSITQFSLDDIRHNRIFYVHDDTDTTADNFTLVITDGINQEFIFNDKYGKNVTTKHPLVFPIKIIPIDDAFPVVVRNEGLQVLKKESSKIWNVISKDILYTEDSDTRNENILYRITLQPHFGAVELTSNPNVRLRHFTQKNIIDGELVYILKNNDHASTEDHFMFSVEDTKPNKVFNNIFVINWARIHFNSSFYNVTETSDLLEFAVIRTGNKNLDFTAACKIETVGSPKVSDSFITIVDEIHFKENNFIKFCIFKVIDNHVFEGRKEFEIFLTSNTSLLASPRVSVITITDEEDEPIINFKKSVFKINETDEYFNFPIIREGDLNQELSVLCSTSDVTAQGSNTSSLQTGSDYRSRDTSYHSFITFPRGISEMMCSVKVIDDNLFEDEEEFLLLLSKPHPIGKIGGQSKAHVVILGPNDAPHVFIEDKKYEMFIGEQNSSVNIVRQDGDMSKLCTVWCGSLLTSSKKSEDHINSYYQITFQPFETSAICLVKTDLKEKIESLTIFLDSANGCVIGKPDKVSAQLKKKVVHPAIEFGVSYVTVQENMGLVHIPILRTGNTSNSATLRCFTQDGTAHAREDYEERYKTRKNSLVHFSPGQKESFCSLNIYDDDTYEGNESFKILLSPFERESKIITLGIKNSATIDITDSEDITLIELEKSHYLVTQSSFPNSSTSAVISVVRHGDTSLVSKVRISTIDGSASSGLDYYAKSKLFSFYPGERKKVFEIEILYNKRRNWAVSFTVILGPDEIVNAEIGNTSKAIVTVPRVPSVDSLILPSVPIVVSLVHYDDVRKGMNQDAKSGYPLVCITPCDVNYPDYAVTSTLCRESGINVSALSYSWEIAMPLNSEKMSAFEKITDSTLFTSAYDRVLDSVYFRPQERVRCVAQPIDSKGNLGIPLRSKSVKISSESGFCLIPSKMQYPSASLSSQPFIATLNYINSSDLYHPNKLHIHIEIPHEHGLLPLLSTYPLHNIEFLLMQNIYRQQHVCSNLLQTTGKSFLKNFHPQLKEVKSAFPYHAEEVTKEMQLIYQHLDLKKCKWSFDAWYSMSDLVELCGGSVISDFKVRDADRTYISVLLPFYVTYVFSAAPTGWTSVEHHTEIEFSFFYDTFLWKGGSHVDDSLNASLSIVRIGTDSSGHLFFEFKTVAKFYGCFVLEHHTLPGIKSRLTVPDGLDLKFNLELLWTEQTFDGPIQFWKATSNYNLKDYSGNYAVHLIPCEVSHAEQFSMHNRLQFLPCIARAPQKFDLPITFQQTLRPKPVTYALETFFQLFNDENLFLLNPFENYLNFQYTEYKGAFSKGENVYGRVFWSPEQELESAYQLKIKEVLLCIGKNGFVPVYDPSGKVYGKGPQYGCLIPNKNLRQKFTLLNRHNPDGVDTVFQGISFNAKFVEDSPEYIKLSDIPGVDGFIFSTDPLYEVSSSQQWFLQVTYSIKATHGFRIRRSSENAGVIPVKEENQTNIKMIFLKMEGSKQSFSQSNQKAREEQSMFGAHHLMYLVSAILIILGILIIGYKNPKLTHHTSTKIFGKYYTWVNSNIRTSSNKSDKFYKVVECKQKIKQTEKCKIRVYSSPKKVSYFTDNSSETEV